MSFLLQCNSKDCRKIVDVSLDQKTNKVHCCECDAEIDNVTQFIKNSLSGIKKFRIPKKSSDPYAIHCKNCNKYGTPKQSKDGFVCPHCNTKHSLSSHFEQMLLNSK